MKLQLSIALSIFLLPQLPVNCVADTATDVLREQVAGNPASAPDAVVAAIKAAGPQAPLLAGPIAAAAIQGLGRDPKPGQIFAIVHAAVRAIPNSALRIVRAAVKVAPSAAPQIAAAAAKAVPNPWKQVRYQDAPTSAGPSNQSAAVPPNNREPDFKSPAEADFKSPAADAPLPVFDAPDTGAPMTQAEAIVQAAFEAAGHQGLAAIQTAVDLALYGDPGGLNAGDPKGISGEGTAGNSNTANEPRLPGTPPGELGNRKLRGGPKSPNPPVVSP